MTIYNGKRYPRARVQKVSPKAAGRLWEHAPWWITFELRPDQPLEWAYGVPIVVHHAVRDNALADAMVRVGRMRGKQEPAGAGDLR